MPAGIIFFVLMAPRSHPNCSHGISAMQDIKKTPKWTRFGLVIIDAFCKKLLNSPSIIWTKSKRTAFFFVITSLKPHFNVKELSLIPLQVSFFLCAWKRPDDRHELFFLQMYMYISTILHICSCSVSSHPCFPNLTVAPGFHGAMSPAW